MVCFSCWSKLTYKTFEFCNEKKEKRREERKRCWRKEREDLVIRQDNCETKKNVTERKGPEGACFCFSFSWSFVYFHSNCAPSFSFVLEITNQKKNENRNDNNENVVLVVVVFNQVSSSPCWCQTSNWIRTVSKLVLLAEWTDQK